MLTEINANESQQKRIIESFFDTDSNKKIPVGLYKFQEIFVGTVNDQKIEYEDNTTACPTKLLIRKDDDKWMSSICLMHNSGKYGTDNQKKDIFYFFVNIEIGYQLNVETKIEFEKKTGINRHTIDNPRSLNYVACVQAKFFEDSY